MTEDERKELELFALSIREESLKSIHSAKSGHPGGSLSAAEYFAYLYGKEMRVDPAFPNNPDRDRFVLSKGHVAPALYAALAQKGYFPTKDLLSLRHVDSYLQGHPNMNTTPGVDMSTGSLGQGVSAAVGMAKGAKYLQKDIKVYTLLGDGELDEGQVWEAMMFAAQYKLDNLCVAVDVNGLQIDGRTEDVMNLEPLDQKFEAFGAAVTRIDGHNLDALEQAFSMFHSNYGNGKPTVILMDTIKGKGISFMENQQGWHGAAPTGEQLAQCMDELAAARKRIAEE